MKDALKTLWELQQIDTKIHELEHKLAAIDTGAVARKTLQAAESLHEKSRQTLHDIDAELKDLELSAESTQTKLKNMDQKLYSGKVTNPKELEAMQMDIQMLKRNLDQMETRELELMDAQEEARQTLAKAETILKRKQRELEEILSTGEQSRKELTGELESAKTQRGPVVANLESQHSSLLRKYDSLRAKLGHVAVAGAKDGNCGACHIQIPGYNITKLRDAQEVVTCESCGRILCYE